MRELLTVVVTFLLATSATCFTPLRGQAGEDQVVGPFIDSIDPDRWMICWQTDVPATSIIEVGRSQSQPTVLSQDGRRRDHEIELRELARDGVYKLRVRGVKEDGSELSTAWYDFDAMLHYPPPPKLDAVSPFPGDSLTDLQRATAQLALKLAGVHKGYALVVDGTGRLALELVKRSQLQIVVLQRDERLVQEARMALSKAGCYGGRVTVHHGTYDELSYGPFFANLIIQDPARFGDRPVTEFAPVYRLLKPAGGVMLVGQATRDGTSWTENSARRWIGDVLSANDSTEWLARDNGRFCAVRRGKLPGAGEWTHQYGLPNNTSCSQDELVRGDLSVLWWGRPGPRPMPDRGPRNPAPVSANGRLYVQGNRTLFGMDSYNGAILWFQQIPSMRRANVPRDGSNMVATDDYLYLTLGDRCLGFAGQTGQRQLEFAIPNRDGADACEWGIIACVDKMLFGSSVKRGAQYRGDDGEWYENYAEDQIGRVTSQSLFALDRHTGDLLWEYKNGVIMNSTFSLGESTAYFVESRNPAAITSESGRLLQDVQQEQFLIALDIKTGRARWERPYDFSKCEYMTYMCHANDTLVVVGTDKQKVFHTYAISAVTGSPLWSHETPTRKTHHSGHLSHPLIVGDRLYCNKLTYNLRDGEVVNESTFNWHGCGITSASLHTIFRRYEYHGMLDLATKQRTEFLGVRSGCWLSLIPSGGTVLAPETSAGCSCTHAVQTSMAYVPRHFLAE